jgi:hypothetical protein
MYRTYAKKRPNLVIASKAKQSHQPPTNPSETLRLLPETISRPQAPRNDKKEKTIEQSS